jgi:cytoskeleton protein RodZ
MTDGVAAVTELPASPGARLRREREVHGMSLQQAAEQLNLDVGAVEALEANDFAALGAPVFAKGHLRRYALLLGLPEDDIVAGYDRSRERPGQPTLIPASRLEMPAERTRPNWGMILGATAAFLLAAALAAYVSSYGLRLPWQAAGTQTAEPAASVASGPQAAKSSGDEAAAGSAAAPPGTNTASPGASTTSVPAPVADPGLPPGQVAVLLTYRTDSWTEIYDGTGRSVLYDLGRAGTQRTVTAQAPVSVTLGNGAGVGVAVNGRAVALPAPPPGQTVARFSVGADGAIR